MTTVYVRPATPYVRPVLSLRHSRENKRSAFAKQNVSSKTGIQILYTFMHGMDSRLRGNDGEGRIFALRMRRGNDERIINN
jgi:hypothetical protein